MHFLGIIGRFVVVYSWMRRNLPTLLLRVDWYVLYLRVNNKDRIMPFYFGSEQEVDLIK